MAARKGFTLIELMVVIAIIAILATVGFVSFTNAQIAGRDSRRKQDMRSLETAIELYYVKNHDYPPQSGYCDYVNDSAQSQVAQALVNGGFINQMPTDPSWPGQPNDYYYVLYRYNNANYYAIAAVLENKNDPAVKALAQPVLSNLLWPGSGMTTPFNAIGGCANATNKYNYVIYSS